MKGDAGNIVSFFPIPIGITISLQVYKIISYYQTNFYKIEKDMIFMIMIIDNSLAIAIQC